MIHFLVCFSIWTVILSWMISKMTKGMGRAIDRVKKMHQIPCTNCTYFTENYCLKCTIHPTKALSEDAIYCRDFEVNSDYKTSY